jgi:hypothetical protein
MFHNKIYPDKYLSKNYQDDQYNLIIGIVWGLLCCTCILVLVISFMFMVNQSDNSDSY